MCFHPKPTDIYFLNSLTDVTLKRFPSSRPQWSASILTKDPDMIITTIKKMGNSLLNLSILVIVLRGPVTAILYHILFLAVNIRTISEGGLYKDCFRLRKLFLQYKIFIF